MIIARIIFFSLMALIGLILLGSFIFFYYIAGRNGRALKYTSETAPRSMRDYIRQTEEAEEEIRTMNRPLYHESRDQDGGAGASRISQR